MAEALDKLLVKMGIKKENTSLANTAGLAGGISGGLLAGALPFLVANPNDFGGVGKGMLLDSLSKGRLSPDSLRAFAAQGKKKRNLDALKLGLKTGGVGGLLYGGVGYGMGALADALYDKTGIRKRTEYKNPLED